MKKIRIYSLLLALPLLLQSCLKEQEDFFPESSADRVDAFAQDVKSILTGASNGWKMDMFPSSTQSFGGYTLLLKFSGTSVTAASELADADQRETSLWAVGKSSGVILSFNTYNSLIHYFSGPNKNQGTVYRGLEGDMDFIVLEATPERIKLKGTKSNNTIEMTPVQSGADWTALVTEYKNAAKKYTFNLLEYQTKSDTLKVNLSSRTLSISHPKDDGSMEQVTVSYIFTFTGMKFYKPLVLNGDSIREMIFKQEGDTKFFEDAGGSGAKLVAVIPPLSIQFLNGNWYFAYSAIGPFGKQYWDYVKKNGLDPIEEDLYYAYIGTLNGNYGFAFASSDGTYAYSGALVYTPTVVSNTEVTLKFASRGDDNGAWYYNNASFGYYTAALGNSTAGNTYTLVSDDEIDPTWIKLTDKANPNNYYTLYKTRINWPYEK